MTNKQALAEAIRLLGPTAGVARHPTPSSSQKRAAATRKRKRLDDKRKRETAPLHAIKDSQQRQAALAEYRETHKDEARERDYTHWARFHYQYQVGTSNGAFFVVAGAGDSWEKALAEAAKEKRKADKAEAATMRKEPKRADVRLPAKKRRARLPSKRSRGRRPTRSTPSEKAVTGQRKCVDCGVEIPNRTRCPRCALADWRRRNPEKKREQDRRYREANPEHVRELVRDRVARWHKQQGSS